MRSLLENGAIIALLLATACLQLHAEEAAPVAGWTEDFNTDSWVERWVPGEKGVRRDSHLFPPLSNRRRSVLVFRLFVEKLVHFDSGLPQNSSERALWHVSRMVGDGRVPAKRFVEPNLMRAGRLPVEPQAKLFQPSHNLAVTVASEPSHHVATTSG